MEARVDLRDLVIQPPLVNGSGAVDLVPVDVERAVPVEVLRALGAYVTKTVTVEPRPGNPRPWLAELEPGTVINSVGLANPGARVALRSWRRALEPIRRPVIVSIAGSPDRLSELAEMVDGALWPAAIEINLSCPNVEDAVTDTRLVARSIAAVRERTGLPLLAKLSPVGSAHVDLARAARDTGSDAIVACNSMPSRYVDATGSPVLGAARCGLSGRAVHAEALRIVAELAHAVELPIVGLGGVDTVQAAQRMLDAGASIVGIGTGAMLDHGLLPPLARALFSVSAAGAPPGACPPLHKQTECAAPHGGQRAGT